MRQDADARESKQRIIEALRLDIRDIKTGAPWFIFHVKKTFILLLSFALQVRLIFMTPKAKMDPSNLKCVSVSCSQIRKCQVPTVHVRSLSV